MEGPKFECKKIELTQGVDTIKASSNSGGSGVDNLEYQYGKYKQKYGGDLGKDVNEWKFTVTKPLIGLYGRVTEGKGID